MGARIRADLAGADVFHKPDGGFVVPCAPGADGGNEVESFEAFAAQSVPDFQGDVHAGPPLVQLSLIMGRDVGEGDAAPGEDLQTVEDGGGEGDSGFGPVGAFECLLAVRVEDGLGDKELSAGFYFGVGQAGGGVEVVAEVYGASDAEACGSFQGATAAIDAFVHGPGRAHELRWRHGLEGAAACGKGVSAEDEEVFEAEGRSAEEVILEGEGVHVPDGEGEEDVAAGVAADEVGGGGGVGAGDAAGAVVDGDEIGVESAGGFEEF